jgi:hypothetical protein
VVFVDVDYDGAYSPGEAVSGVRLSSPQISTFNATTATFGGYALPVESAGSHLLRFEGPNLFFEVPVEIDDENVKIDLALGAPEPLTPLVSGPEAPADPAASLFQLSPVQGADRYELQVQRLGLYEEVFDGAPNNDLVIDSPQPQAVLFDDGGDFRYRLAHTGISRPALVIEAPIVPLTGGRLLFEERLGFATADQIATVEVSTDGGLSWSSLRTLAGSGGQTHTKFVAAEIDLNAFARRMIRLRFVFSFDGGSFFNANSSPSAGWFLDKIRLENVREVLSEHQELVENPNAHALHPGVAGDFLLQGRARLYGGLNLPWSEGFLMSVNQPLSSNPFWNATLHAAHWRQSSWMGFLNEERYPYFYHYNLGWLYHVSGNPAEGLWMYSPQMGWVWIQENLWPVFFRLEDEAWYFYLQGTGGGNFKTWFYVFGKPAPEDYISFALTFVEE